MFLMLFAILFPILASLGICHKRVSGSLRTLHGYVFTAVLLTSLVNGAAILSPRLNAVTLLHFTDTLSLTLAADGLSRVFLTIIAILWPLTTVYAFEYMKHETNEPRFFAFFLLSYGVSSGIAYAGNPATLYLFFELLTLATLPLVMHKMDDRARCAGRRYLLYSMAGASLGFLSIVFIDRCGVGTTFALGGVLGADLDAQTLTVLRAAFVLAFFGFGVKAALMPMSFWLPAASVAPTPVTALLHAAAVVKAGAFACLRMTYYTYGAQVLRGTFAQYVPMAAAIFTIAFGSLMALRMNHLKRRLAWSTVSNLSYILFSATLMTTLGLKAACMHMLAHAFIKITLFFGVGSILVSTGKEYLDEIGGLAKRMPHTFACFSVASAALMGLPPMPGFFSKWAIGSAANYSGSWLAIVGIGALMASAFLTALYLISILSQAYFGAGAESGPRCDKPLMAAPQAILCVMIVLMGLFNQTVQHWLDLWLF